MKYIGSIFFLLIWLGGTVWASSGLFVDAEVAAKWFWTLFGLCGWIVWKGGFGRDLPTGPTSTAGCIVACAGSMALYAALQAAGICTGRNGFPITGTFDNPAGLASLLSLSVPFCFLLLRQSRCTMVRVVVGFALCGMVWVVVLSDSRAGMATVGCIAALYGLLLLRGKWRWGWLAGCLAAALWIGQALYLHKKASADGRILIWQCTANMIAERPLTGYGPGGFEAHYMDFQARYFATHPDSRFTLLADDVKQPFNEYLGLLADYGLAGALCLLGGMAGIGLLYRKREPGKGADEALLCLAGIAVFSLFSYPLRYPHTLLYGCLSLGMLYRSQSVPHRWRMPTLFIGLIRKRSVRLGLGILLATAVAVPTALRMEAEIRWTKTARKALSGQGESAFQEYEKLMNRLGHVPLFLYNYAAELNVAGHYAESLRIALLCEARFADYYTQLLLADNYKHLGHPEAHAKALRHLRRAACMCPGRLLPWREMCDVYTRMGQREKATAVARKALKRPAKVESAEVQALRQEIREKFIP